MLLLKTIFQLTLYTLACLGAGWTGLYALTRAFRQPDTLRTPRYLITAFALGLGILAACWEVFALAGHFSRPVVIGSVVLLGLCGLIYVARTMPALIATLKRQWALLGGETWGWRFIAFFTLAFALSGWLAIGKPMVGDGNAYYFSYAKFIAYSERLIPLPAYESFSMIGVLGEMHYAALMVLGHHDLAARLFSWVTFLFTAPFLVLLCKGMGLHLRGRLIALATLFSSSAIVYSYADGKVDLFAAMLGTATFSWLLLPKEEQRPFTFFLGGLLAGFSIVAKYSYLVTMLPAIFLLPGFPLLPDFWLAMRQKNRLKFNKTLRQCLTSCVFLGLGLLVAYLPHGFKNGVLFANPFLPFFSGNASLGQVWFSSETTHRILLSYPLVWVYGLYWAQGGGLSPLILSFLPLALFLKKPRSLFSSRLALGSIAATLGLVCWAITNPAVVAPRYLFATLILFIPLSAGAAEAITATEKSPRWLSFSIILATGLLLLYSSSQFLEDALYPQRSWQLLRDQIPECDVHGEYCQAMQTINHQADPGDRVYLMTDGRYWLRPDLLQCVSQSPEFTRIKAADTPADRWMEIYRLGFHYLITDAGVEGELEKMNFNHPPDWVKIELLYSGSQLKAYWLNFESPPVSKEYRCTQTHPPAWEVEKIVGD